MAFIIKLGDVRSTKKRVCWGSTNADLYRVYTNTSKRIPITTNTSIGLSHLNISKPGVVKVRVTGVELNINKQSRFSKTMKFRVIPPPGRTRPLKSGKKLKKLKKIGNLQRPRGVRICG